MNFKAAPVIVIVRPRFESRVIRELWTKAYKAVAISGIVLVPELYRD